MSSLSYKNAGVDIEKAEKFVGFIKRIVKQTYSSSVKEAPGGYASIYEINDSQYLAASTDGVGTKLKLAFDLNKHDTVGIDLVAMSVNDLICVQAKPLFFLDYIATGKLDLDTSQEIIKGIVSGCKMANIALVGGETAEMPGFYKEGEYDLAGFAVGIIDKDNYQTQNLSKGDVLIGIASSGFHSNGYSLLRKLIAGNDANMMANELLTPTKIYVNSLMPLMNKKIIKAAAHITGSGFINILRVTDKFSAEIYLPPLSERPKVFSWLRSLDKLSLQEECRTFNMGVGMVLIVNKSDARMVLEEIRNTGETVWEIGELISSKTKSKEIHISENSNSITLQNL